MSAFGGLISARNRRAPSIRPTLAAKHNTDHHSRSEDDRTHRGPCQLCRHFRGSSFDGDAWWRIGRCALSRRWVSPSLQ